MSSLQQKQVDTYYLAVCPECNKYLEYTIDAKVDYLYRMTIDKDIDSKMKQAAKAAIAQHNSIQEHSAHLIEYKLVEDSDSEVEKEILKKEKIAILKGIISLR